MKRILFFLLFTIIAFSCEKKYYTSIPNYQVNLELNLSTLDYALNTSLGYKVITQPRVAVDRLGFGGILVINGFGENIVNIYAYDLACPEEAQNNIRIAPDNISSSSSAVPTAITATCPKCGSVFTIANGRGTPQSGSKYYLKSYQVVGKGTQFTVIN